MSDCQIYQPQCILKEKTGDVVTDLAGSALEKIANSIGEAVADGLTAVGTLWINIGTPNLTSTGTSPRPAGAPGHGQVEQILGYVTYVGLFVCIASLMVAGVRLARPASTNVADEGARIGIVLMATILLSGAAALVGGLAQGVDRSTAGNGTTGFLQNSLWPYTLALAVVSVLVAGTKMAWEQRAQPGRDLVKSLLTLILVAGAAVPVVGILITASDEFSRWIIRQSLSCDPSSSTSCFKDNVAGMVAVSTTGGVFMTIVLGLVALLTSLLQIMLMVARSGMLVLLVGLLPLTAAATNTEMGNTWFKRGIAWLVAWLLYKPAAAIIYATAFQLSGTKLFRDDTTGLISVLSGLMLMILAILALPALMRFVTPAVSSMAAGAGGGMAAVAAMSPALGAVSAGGRSMAASSTSAGGTSSENSPSGSGLSGGGGSPGGSGLQGASGPKGGSPSSGGSGASTSRSAGAGAGAGSGAGAATADSGAGASGAAAAGPVGIAIAGAQAAKQGIDTAISAAASTADGATNSGGSKES